MGVISCCVTVLLLSHHPAQTHGERRPLALSSCGRGRLRVRRELWHRSERGHGRARSGNLSSRLFSPKPACPSLPVAGGSCLWNRRVDLWGSGPFPCDWSRQGAGCASSSPGRPDEIAASGRMEVTKRWRWLSLPLAPHVCPKRSSVCPAREQGFSQPPAPQEPLHGSNLLQDKH